MDINTCFETTKDYHTIAFYSHLVPVFITLLLSIFVLVKTKKHFLSKVFFFFSLSFCLWLVGDLFLWTSSNYNLVNFIWAPLDYINVLFYLLGAYFFIVLIDDRDISVWQKVILFGLSLPAWYITFSNNSITSFNLSQCEAFNSTLLTQYKLGVEIVVIAFIVLYGFYKHRTATPEHKRKIIFVGAALILFFVVFSSTEYIASVSGLYEINLYGLFVLPLFLVFIIYAVIDLHIFELHVFGVQLLIYTLMILIGSQFFFLRDTTDKIVTTVTFALSLVFSFMTIRTTRRESEARIEIQVLADKLTNTNHHLNEANTKLKTLDKLKTEFLSLASHQLRSPLTSIKGYASMLDEGSYGKLTEQQDGAVQRIYSSAQGLVSIVEDLLNVSKIEQGGMKYELSITDLQKIVVNLVEEMRIPAEGKKLELRAVVPQYDRFLVSADPLKIKQVFLNLVDNAIKYTPAGSVEVGLRRTDEQHVVFYVKDTGMGVTEETKGKLFQKFNRGEAGKVNTGGSGLGLYLAQQIVTAHKGTIVIDSEGEGKGATFSVTLPAVGAHVTPDTMPT